MDKIITSFGIDWKIVLASLFNFLVVIWVIYYFLNKKVFSVLEERRAKIKEGVEKYEKSDEILEKARKDGSEIIKKANITSDEKIQKAKELAEEKTNKILEEAKVKADNEKKKIILNAEEEKNKIIKSAKDEIVEIAILQSEKILSTK